MEISMAEYDVIFEEGGRAYHAEILPDECTWDGDRERAWLDGWHREYCTHSDYNEYFSAGWDAFANNEPFDSCPHEGIKGFAWRNGWGVSDGIRKRKENL